MIYFEGLDSVIESIYLDDELGNKVGDCSVFINPENTRYLIGKVVIINSLSYPSSKVIELLDNGNTVVRRIKPEDAELEDGVLLQPYILRYNGKIQYSGKEIRESEELSNLDILRDYCSLDSETGVLYFPKLLNPGYSRVLDREGNLSSLGWALQEIGVNIKKDTRFRNLDILKLKKIELD